MRAASHVEGIGKVPIRKYVGEGCRKSGTSCVCHYCTSPKGKCPELQLSNN